MKWFVVAIVIMSLLMFIAEDSSIFSILFYGAIIVWVIRQAVNTPDD